MSELKLQIGKSIRSDFSKKTWVFRVDNDIKVSSGEFAIVPLQKFNELVI